MGLIKVKAIADFMRNRVRKVMAEEAILISEWAEFYLVNLLITYLFTDAIFDDFEKETSRPLALDILETWSGQNTSDNRTRLRHIGDRSLFISGVFAEHIASAKLISPNYYRSIGKGAYATLAAMLSGCDTSKLFTELSDRFDALAAVLFLAASCDRIHNASELIKLYSRWLETQDKKLLSKLQRHGLASKNN